MKAALFFLPPQIVVAQNPGTRAGERLVITNKGLAAASGLAIRKVSGPEADRCTRRKPIRPERSSSSA